MQIAIVTDYFYIVELIVQTLELISPDRPLYLMH
jgi:hypothetical protein